MPAYPNAHAKVKKCIWEVKFPENWFEFGIIEHDFLRSTIWAIQIQILFSESKNPKNPWIQPTDNASFFKYFSSLGYLPLLEQLSKIYSTLLSS